MPRKTIGEMVDELIVLTATLDERTKRFPEHTDKVSDMSILFQTLNVRIDNVHQELKELKKDLEAARNRLWTLVPAIVGAFLGAGLMAALNYLVRH